MRSFPLAATLLALPLAVSAPRAVAQDAPPCPISGIQTFSLGTGSGFLNPPVLDVTFDAGTCSLDFAIDAATCCNTFVSQHVLVLGGQLDPPLDLVGPPFLAGCQLYVWPLLVTGPHPGTESSLPLPPNPNLVGKAFDVQAIPYFFTTIGLTTDLGTTNKVRVLFQ